jgi:hypothetical protein
VQSRDLRQPVVMVTALTSSWIRPTASDQPAVRIMPRFPGPGEYPAGRRRLSTTEKMNQQKRKMDRAEVMCSTARSRCAN